MQPLLALIVALPAANGVLRTTGAPFVSPAQRAGWETKGDSGLKGRDGWGRGVRPCFCPVADFQPAASATANNPAVTSWAKECRAVGPRTARFDQTLGKRPFKSLSGQAFGAQGPLQSSLFLPTQNVEEPFFLDCAWVRLWRPGSSRWLADRGDWRELLSSWSRRRLLGCFLFRLGLTASGRLSTTLHLWVQWEGF